ncbi:MAG: hypothetical protein FWB93_02345 [Oscillospiraceae bacterium]|nr:hypothetical protein [Oscillospiraceae bacterium]
MWVSFLFVVCVGNGFIHSADFVAERINALPTGAVWISLSVGANCVRPCVSLVSHLPRQSQEQRLPPLPEEGD